MPPYVAAPPRSACGAITLATKWPCVTEGSQEYANIALRLAQAPVSQKGSARDVQSQERPTEKP